MKRFLVLVAVLVLNPLWAAPEFVPIQEKAQGQALAGSNQLNDSLYSNPAASAFVNVYSLDASLSLPRTFAVSVIDTKTSTMGGGLGYFRRELGKDYYAPGISPSTNANYVQGAKLAFLGKVSNEVAVGVAGKSIWGPNTEGKQSRLNDMDTGILYNAGMYQFGFSTRNTLGGDRLLQAEREFAIGARLGYEDVLSLSLATQSKFSTPKPYQYGIGAEYVSPYYFALKGGYRVITTESQSFWSVGASFVSPKISFHYAMEIPNQPNSSLEHVFGSTLLF